MEATAPAIPDLGQLAAPSSPFAGERRLATRPSTAVASLFQQAAGLAHVQLPKPQPPAETRTHERPKGWFD